MRCPNLFKASGLTHPSEQIDRLKSWQAKRSEDVDGYDNWDLIASGRYHAGITRIFGNYHFVLFFSQRSATRQDRGRFLCCKPAKCITLRMPGLQFCMASPASSESRILFKNNFKIRRCSWLCCKRLHCFWEMQSHSLALIFLLIKT